MNKQADRVLAGLRQTRQGLRLRRSALYRWLFEHQDSVRTFLVEGPSWTALAVWVKEQAGIETSRQAVQQTWQRLERDVGAVRVVPPAKAAAVAKPVVAPTKMPEPGDDFELKPLKR